MKRIFGAMKRWGQNVGVEERALKEVERIEKGEKTVRSPLHPTEAKIVSEKAAEQSKYRDEIERKYEALDENLRRIEIKVSSIPPKKNPSDRLLPSQESEYRHRNDQPWEYGFYEPPEEKVQRNRLTFREALALMKAQVEVKNKGEGIEEAKRILREHPAAVRVERSHIDRMLQFFLPFEVIKEQRRISVKDMIRERQRLQGMDDFKYIADKNKEWQMNLDMKRAREALFFEEDEKSARRIEGDKEEESNRSPPLPPQQESDKTDKPK